MVEVLLKFDGLMPKWKLAILFFAITGTSLLLSYVIAITFYPKTEWRDVFSLGVPVNSEYFTEDEKLNAGTHHEAKMVLSILTESNIFWSNKLKLFKKRRSDLHKPGTYSLYLGNCTLLMSDSNIRLKTYCRLPANAIEHSVSQFARKLGFGYVFDTIITSNLQITSYKKGEFIQLEFVRLNFKELKY